MGRSRAASSGSAGGRGEGRDRGVGWDGGIGGRRDIHIGKRDNVALSNLRDVS